MTRLLVTGAAGQLGTELLEVAAGRGFDVVGATRVTGFDLLDADSVWRSIVAAAPEVIVHAAAWTDVDGCELDEARAMAVNGTGTAGVVAAADEVGARVIYVSTDYVFDGTAERYEEDATPNPMSAYGRSKLAGEQALRPTDTIARTSWVCGRHGHNIVRTVLALAAKGQPMRFVDDQFGRPTFTEALAPALADLAVADVGATAGVFHVTNETTCSWYGFVQAILTSAGYDPALVSPIATADLDPPRPAPRPARSVLVDTRLSGAGVADLGPMDAPLARLIADLTAP